MNQGLRQTDLIQPAPLGTAPLSGAAVNVDVILEPSERDPRQGQGVRGARDVDPHVTASTIPLPGAATIPRPPAGQGLRLVPVSGFFWGGAVRGRSGPGLTVPTPRVRGDHVILLIRDGSAAIDFPRIRHTLGPGELACIPVGTAFALKPPATVTGWALLVPSAFATNLPVALPHEFTVGMPDQTDLTLIEPALTALGNFHGQDSIARAAAACHLGLLAVALTRLHDHTSQPPRPDRPALEARPLTERFLALAAARLAMNCTVSELAQDLGCTLAELDEACRQSRGRSALDLVYVLRLERATDLLRHGEMPVAQIAEELGYTGLGHFMRAFASATGRSPQAFRDWVQARTGTD